MYDFFFCSVLAVGVRRRVQVGSPPAGGEARRGHARQSARRGEGPHSACEVRSGVQAADVLCFVFVCSRAQSRRRAMYRGVKPPTCYALFFCSEAQSRRCTTSMFWSSVAGVKLPTRRVFLQRGEPPFEDFEGYVEDGIMHNEGPRDTPIDC